MPKVMLVEDDNALREIYDARLMAEGYEIVSAHDGEEALALAVKEKPDLIISDVMMPKISGFDMLDILRSTPETKNTKVIMMTALSQAEDRERAGKLGADRYLVKSQVTLEDVIKVAHEILNDSGPAPAAVAGATQAPVTATVTNDAPVAAPPAAPVADEPASAPTTTDLPVAEPPVATPSTNPAPAPEPTPAPAAPTEPTTTVTTVEPLDDSSKKEEPTPAAAPEVATEPSPAAEAPASAPEAPLETPTASAPPVPEATPTANPIDDNLTQTKDEQTDGVEKQIQDFVANNPTLTTAADASAPTNPAPAPTPAATSIPVTTPDDTPATAPTPPAETAVPAATPAPDPQDELSNPTAHTSSASNPEPPSHRKLVLTPTDNALAPAVDLDALLAKENANDAVPTPGTNTVITPATEGDDQPTSTVSPNDISL